MIAKIDGETITIKDGNAVIRISAEELADLAKMACPRETLDGDREEEIGVPEASRILGVSDASVRYWLREGDLAGYKVGKTWRVRRADVLAMRGEK